MPSRRRTTQWELFFQYLVVPLNIVSGVVLVPLYLKLIPQDIYGAWLATGNVLGWLTIADPGLSGVLRQRVAAAYGRGDYRTVGELASGGLLITAGVVGLVVIGGLVVGVLLPAILHAPATLDTDLIVRAFLVTVFGAGGFLYYYSVDAICKGLQQTLAMGVVLTGVRLLYLGVLLVLLFGGMGVMALAYGQLFNGLALSLFAMLFLWQRLRREGIRLRLSMSRVPELFHLLSFTFFARGFSVLAANLDLILTSRLLGPAGTPILALTRRVPESIRPVVDRPAHAFLPAVSLMVGSGEIPRVRTVLIRLCRILLWALGLFTVGFMLLNGDFVRMWVGPQFFAGNTVNILICAGIVLSVAESSLNGLCFAMGDIKGTSILGAVRGMVCVVLMLVLGQSWGMTGFVAAPVAAILATSAGYLLWSFNRRLGLDRLQRRVLAIEFLRVVLVCTIVTLVFAWFHADTWLRFTALFTGVVLLYGGTLAALSAAFRREMAGAFAMIRVRAGGHAG